MKPVVTLADVIAANFDREMTVRLRDLVEFDGPATAHVAGNVYDTLTQYGLKKEGWSAYPENEPRCWTEAEAIWRFKHALRDYLVAHEGSQLAWRNRPTVTKSDDGDYVVRCRLAVV